MTKDYYINVEDDVVTPEETLLDGDSTFSNIERPIRPAVFKIIFWSVAGMLGIIFLASANLSVINHAYYANLAFQNRSANFSVPPARGIIFDQNGQPLVKNIPQFDVVGVSKEVKTALKNGTLDLNQLGIALGVSTETLANQLNDQAQQANVFFIANNLQKDQILAIQGLKSPVSILSPMFSGYISKGQNFQQCLDMLVRLTKTISRMIRIIYPPIPLVGSVSKPNMNQFFGVSMAGYFLAIQRIQ
jgi:hypothetical protein